MTNSVSEISDMVLMKATIRLERQKKMMKVKIKINKLFKPCCLRC